MLQHVHCLDGPVSEIDEDVARMLATNQQSKSARDGVVMFKKVLPRLSGVCMVILETV